MSILHVANMSGRYAALVQGLTIDDDEEYEAVKGRMLEAAGLTTMDAGQQLFQLNSTDTRGKTALEVFQLVTRLIKRIYKGAVTVHDYLLAIAVPVLRKMLPKEGVIFLDQKCPKSMEALLDSLQQWWAITRGRTSEDKQPKPKPSAFPPGRFGALKCFILNVAQGPLLALTPARCLLRYPRLGTRDLLGRATLVANEDTSLLPAC